MVKKLTMHEKVLLQSVLSVFSRKMS